MQLPTRPARGRPAGSLGEVARALLDAAREQPGTARELSRRACVGERVGMYTVSRLVDGGQLVRLLERRPAVLATPDCAAVCLVRAVAESPALQLLGRLMPRGVADPAMS